MIRKTIKVRGLALFLAAVVLLGGIGWRLAGAAAENKTLKLTLTEAIYMGKQNNLDLKLLNEDLALRELDHDKALYFSDQQKDADQKIRDGRAELAKQRAEFEKIKDFLDAATRKAMEDQLAAAEAELAASEKYAIDTLEEAQVAHLIEKKAKVALEVTKLARELAAEKTALLVQKDYYDVLKVQELVKVKKGALERAKFQLQLAQAGYEAGMRAKDDWLLAKAQVSLLEADLTKGENDLLAAMLELKKVLNVDSGVELQLADDFTTGDIKVNFSEDLERGLAKRVEVRKAEGELEVYRVNFDLAKSYGAPNTFTYREAEINLRKAEVELTKQKLYAQADIRQSYNNLMAARVMLGDVEDSLAQAKESVDIAMYRYQEGFGLPNSTLKGLHAEDAAGTILEVLAAQEKLAEIEEKVVNITYSYNLARNKYLIDSGQDLQ